MKALVISCGLIGGGIAKALVKAGWEVHGTSRQNLNWNGITFYKAIEEVPNLSFDVICVCCPRGEKYEIYKQVFEQISHLKAEYIVDVSSVQNQNVFFQKKYKNFIPCHPIAGSEKTGFTNSSAEMLEGKRCMIMDKNPPKKVVDFWQACKMNVHIIPSCIEHDRIFAKISHLPQLLSFCFPEENHEHRAFYRLKNSSREIWMEIFLHNCEAILNALELFEKTFFQKTNDGSSFEKIISNIFLEITSPEEKILAGTGFQAVTSCSNLTNNGGNGYEAVRNTIAQAKNMVSSFLGKKNIL